MHKKVTLEKPIPIIFSIIVFTLLIAGLLALQNIFNGEMKILYDDLGKNLTNINQSYIASIIFFASLIILLIMSHILLNAKATTIEMTLLINFSKNNSYNKYDKKEYHHD